MRKQASQKPRFQAKNHTKYDCVVKGNVMTCTENSSAPPPINLSTEGDFLTVNRSTLEALGVDVDKLKNFLGSLRGADYSDLAAKGNAYAADVTGNSVHSSKKIQSRNIVKNDYPKFKTQTVSPTSSDDDIDGDTYDYVVVGSGPGGSTIAYNLMKAGKDVLLLEAGDDDSASPFIRGVPLGNPRYFYTKYMWMGDSMDQTQFPPTLLGGVTYQWRNGRTGGGGSSINGAQLVDSIGGNALYWDTLAAQLGDPTWNSTNMVNIRKKIEKLNTTEFVADASRGTSGPIEVITVPLVTAGSDAETMANAVSAYFGIPLVDDYNLKTSPASCAFKQWQITYDLNIVRQSADYKMIIPFVDSNGKGTGIAKGKLRYVPNATVTRFTFSMGGTPKLNGLQYDRYGKARCVNIGKEVILATNLNTTQLLQHNGIGPASVLNAANESIVVDSSHVGRHLRNHALLLTFWLDFTGTFTGNYGGAENAFASGAFMEYPAFVPAGNRAVQFIFLTLPTGPPGAPVAVVPVPVFLIPYSEGSAEIANQDPNKIIQADPNYYNDNNGTNPFPPAPYTGTKADNTASSIDMALALQALQDIRDFALSLNLFAVDPPLADYSDLAVLETFIATKGAQAHHWQGENRMGTNINNGVCDSKGRVFGVKGLRLAGATILPSGCQGNLAQPSYYTGQKIAEDILAGN